MINTLNLLASGGLIIYIIILAFQLEDIMTLWQLREMIPIIQWLAILALVLNAGFFVWTCLMIYQLLFDLQPHTYSQTANLLLFCWMDIVIECLKNRFLN